MINSAFTCRYKGTSYIGEAIERIVSQHKMDIFVEGLKIWIVLFVCTGSLVVSKFLKSFLVILILLASMKFLNNSKSFGIDIEKSWS